VLRDRPPEFPFGHDRLASVAGHEPTTFDAMGRGIPEPERHEERLELIGTYLRAEGAVDLGRFARLSDYVNFLGGFFSVRDVTLLSRVGTPTRVTFPDLRVRLADIALVAQRATGPAQHAGATTIIPKQRRRLVVMTEAHIVYGWVFVHEESSVATFIDSPEPHFVPMTGVRVRWLTDRRLAGRFEFALLQRSHIVGVAADSGPEHRDEARPVAGEPRPIVFEPRPLAGEPRPLAFEQPPLGILAQRKKLTGA
jgi:hypothetical protein